MKIEGDKIFMNDGTEYDANCGIIGLSPKCLQPDGNCVYQGYDGQVGWDLSKKHAVEIADYMIDLWNKFKMRQAASEV